ncbi:MAG: CotH kinase family protein [Candidatus Omnitrophica bacterium]|nr:CotH kinase family protein [Candidatus Omnitrophota bacterium]
MNKLVADESDFVPAEIRYNGKSIKVRLRLKGDHTDHFEGNKWSFRIKTRGNETLFGMRIFSIQHPKTRNYIYEWLYHEALKREGFIALRYDFINVTLNGKDLGVYAIEEFFEKRLIEHNKHREGPIIRFDENMMWQELLQRGRIAESGTYLSSSIDAFQTNRTLEDPVNRQQFIKAISLLESFRKGDLKTSDVFDADKLATFFAVSDLMGAEHATSWINMRFYFNPITTKLEPIGFDGTCSPISNLSLKQPDDTYGGTKPKSILESFCAALLSDKEFYQKYIKELERVSNPDYLNNFFNEIEHGLEKRLNIIYKEFPYYNFSKDIYYNNIHVINITLNPVKILNVYLHEIDKDGIALELGNMQSMAVEVKGVFYKGSTLFRPLRKIILAGKKISQPAEYKNVKFLFPDDFTWGDKDVSELKLNCKIFGATQDRHEDIFPYRHMDKFYIDVDVVRQRPNIHGFDFIMMNEDEKRISIIPGEWALSENLIIPDGYTVVCFENTTLNLLNRAKVLSYSPFEFIGTKEYPILIYSEDSTGEGIVVMCKGRKSILKNVVFKNLGVPVEPGWGITGAVSFYESPVELYQCKFIGNRAEDTLNVIRSEFIIDGTLFTQTFSDAFDSDFGKGKITNCSFLQCGNDGIDISGSAVQIENVFIVGAGDKGISVGELSNASIDQAKIENSNIAVASKDSSVVNISGLDVSGCNVGFAVYRKKPEFGPAEINIEHLKLNNVDRDHLIEAGSKVTVDGVNIQPNEKNVYVSLYGKK